MNFHFMNKLFLEEYLTKNICFLKLRTIFFIFFNQTNQNQVAQDTKTKMFVANIVAGDV